MTKHLEKLRVSFLLPQVIMGGIEKVLLTVLTQLQKTTDWNLRVYSLAPIKDRYFIDFFLDNHITYKDNFKLEKPKEFWGKIKYKFINPFQKIIGMADLRQTDILIDFQFFSFAPIIKKLPCPKITWAHGSINYFNANNEKFMKYIKYYDRLVCLSEAFIKDFTEQYPDYADKIVHIYNPINIAEIRAKGENTRRCAGKYFCIVSRLDYEKDNETVISAFKMFAKRQPDAQLYVVGEGGLKQKLARMAADCPQIEFLGQINEPYGIIKGSVAHILASYNEGLPTVLLENAALGALSIASNCKSSVAEVLLNGRAGILFNPGDTEQLAEIMFDVWSGKIATDKLIKTATDNLNRFSVEQNVSKIVDLINNVLAGQGDFPVTF